MYDYMRSLQRHFETKSEHIQILKAEAKEKLRKALEESRELDIIRSDDYTVGEWVKTWFELYAKPNIRPNTSDYYQRFINCHIIPDIGHIKLTKRVFNFTNIMILSTEYILLSVFLSCGSNVGQSCVNGSICKEKHPETVVFGVFWSW